MTRSLRLCFVFPFSDHHLKDAAASFISIVLAAANPITSSYYDYDESATELINGQRSRETGAADFCSSTY